MSLDPEARAALERWQVVSKKLTQDQRDHVNNLVSVLGDCLKFAHGRIWLSIAAQSVLAYELYGVGFHNQRGDPVKGTNKIKVSNVEMHEWCQEAIDKRFKESPGKVTSVTKESSGGGTGNSGFEITLAELVEPVDAVPASR